MRARATGTLIKFGIFAIVMAMLTAFQFFIFGQMRTGATNGYSAVFADASRLEAGDTVRVAGIRVGTVNDVSLDADRKVLVKFDADRSIVLTTADRARDLKPKPAYLAGYGQRLHFEVAGRIGSLSSYMAGGSSSAKLTWERSGFTPKDVDVAQIYDGFSASVIYGLESYGFCQEGEALDFIQDGRIELDGDLPLNTFGGSLGTGRIHGLWHIIEGALQASGRAGSRQVKDANVSFVGASAPIVTGTTFIFVGEPY